MDNRNDESFKRQLMKNMNDNGPAGQEKISDDLQKKMGEAKQQLGETGKNVESSEISKGLNDIDNNEKAQYQPSSHEARNDDVDGHV